MSRAILEKARKAWIETQIVKLPETKISKQEFLNLKNNWKNDKIPELQKKVTDVEVSAFKTGDFTYPIYSSFAKLVDSIDLDKFSLLDAACGAAHYYEALKYLVKNKDITYYGSDYSKHMIKNATKLYPEVSFFVQDLCEMGENTKQFDAVMLSGVIEHVADWELAINNAAKITKSHMIIHRGQFSLSETVYTKSGQYNIVTPKAYISKSDLISRMNDNGFDVVKELEFSSGSREVTLKMKNENSFQVDRTSILFKR